MQRKKYTAPPEALEIRQLPSAIYQSDPTANRIIYIDASQSNYSDYQVEDIARRVALNFSDWRVNVTTVDPGIENLRYTGFGDNVYGIEVNLYVGGFGGQAIIGSFGNWGNTPAYVTHPGTTFMDVDMSVYAITHEVGHTLGLDHEFGPNQFTFMGYHTWENLNKLDWSDDADYYFSFFLEKRYTEPPRGLEAVFAAFARGNFMEAYKEWLKVAQEQPNILIDTDRDGYISILDAWDEWYLTLLSA